MSKLEGGKIPARQLLALLLISRLVPITLAFPLITDIPVPQDAWLASLASAFIALPPLLLVAYLGTKFPGLTIIQYTQVLLGPYLGRAAGLALIWYWLHIASTVARELGEAYTAAIMPETPILVFMAVMVLLGANAARNGLEVVGRMGEHSVWIILAFLGVIAVLPYDVMEFSNLLPVLAGGISTTLGPTLNSTAFFMELIILGMILPHLNKPDRAARYTIYTVIISGLIITWFAAVLVQVFGPTVSALTLPTYSLSRMISIAEFLERIEALSMGAWTLSAGIKLALFLWACSVGLAQLLGLARYQPLVYPLGALAVAMGLSLYESNLDLELFLSWQNYGLYSTGLVTGLITALYLAYLVRARQYLPDRR